MIESHTYLAHYHGNTLETIKAIKIIRGTLDVAFELATNAVSERSCSTLCISKFYLRSSITQEPLSSCLVIATCKKKADKLTFVEVANQFCFENENHFSI